MDRRNSHIDINHLQSINKPTVIKTSKNWVLPPRPRPGRKPNSSSTASVSSASSSCSSASCANTAPTQAKKGKKKDHASSIQSALEKIQNENQFLKIELSKLVSDLKTLQSQSQSQSQSPNTLSSSASSSTSSSSLQSPASNTALHKKRNHLEMEELNTYKTLSFDESDDDNVSQISTPSLMSNSSVSIGSTLSSVPEDDVLKIEDFLNLSYFESSGSAKKEHCLTPISANLHEDNIEEIGANKIKRASDQEIEFQFLKDQGVFKGEKDLFLEVGNTGEEIIEW